MAKRFDAWDLIKPHQGIEGWDLFQKNRMADGFKEALGEIQEWLGGLALQMIRRKMDKANYPGASQVSQATIAILAARQQVPSKFGRKLHYSKAGAMPNRPLRRNDRLYNAFKVMKTGRSVTVGIHGNSKGLNGTPLADIARWHREGYRIRVTRNMRRFFTHLRGAVDTKIAALKSKKGPKSPELTSFRKLAMTPFKGVNAHRPVGVPAPEVGQIIEVRARNMLEDAERFFAGKNPGALKAVNVKARRLFKEAGDKMAANVKGRRQAPKGRR